jgi:hypothetical protein
MVRIIIIGEGQTEQSFCSEVLQPYFTTKEIYIQNPVIKKTQGGIVNWHALKYQIETHLLQDPTAFVTTLIDYYGIHAHHQYPFWEEAEGLNNKNERMVGIERGMLNDITPNLQPRFIPYIQLHEFEGLLFSDLSVIRNRYEEHEFSNFEYLEETVAQNSNPELINKGIETAPSKRLKSSISSYGKTSDGIEIAKQIGLSKIREKCPRFNEWINKIEKIKVL